MRRLVAIATAVLVGVVGCAHRDVPSTLTALCPENSFECFDRAISKLQQQSDQDAVDALATWAERGGSHVGSWCHALAHLAGTRAADAGRGPLLALEVPYLCGGGFVHGNFAAWAYRTGSAAESAAACEQLDASNPPVLSWDCWHGVGHAAGAAAIDEVQAWRTCEQFAIPDGLKDACRSGAASSIADRWTGNTGHGVRNNRLDPVQPWCAVAGPSIFACWERVPRAVGLSQALELCRNAADDARSYCARGVGRITDVRFLPDGGWDESTLEQTRRNCEALGSDLLTSCLEGAVEELVLHGSNARESRSVCPALSPAKLLGWCVTVESGRRAFEVPGPLRWRLRNDTSPGQ